MVDFLCKRYADKFKYMIVGTGESINTISFIKTAVSHFLILFLISLLPIMIILL